MAPFVFRRYAGSFQVVLRSFGDLQRLDEVREAHWVATACPILGMDCDARFLASLDVDGNGRVRAAELRAAIHWTARMLADTARCVPGSDVLELRCLASEAAPLRAVARLILANLGTPDAPTITLAQVRQTSQQLRRVTQNGDGVVSPLGLPDAGAGQLVRDIIAILPGAMDLSGERGVDRATVLAFASARQAALAWLERRASLLVWGEDSEALASLVRRLQPRLDEYFLQCRLVASQPSAAERFALPGEQLAALLGDAAGLRQALDRLPIAPPRADGVLRWSELVRGPEVELLQQLRHALCERRFPGLDSLDEARWRQLVGEAAPLLAWMDERASHPVLALGEARLRAISDADVAALDQHCVEDLKVNDTLARLGELERLVLCQRWLFVFANNLVSMPYLYANDRRAMFEQGTLILAGREFSFSVLVVDRASHAALAANAAMFILYARISGGTPAREFEVAVPVTSGTSAGIFVGKRGIFIAIDGQEYDAQVMQLIVQPVSVGEAVLQPFRRIVSFFSNRIEDWSSSADKALEQHLAQTTTLPAALPGAGPPAAAPAAAAAPAPSAGLSGLLMGGGVAFASIGAAFAFTLNQLREVRPIYIAIGILAACLLVALPAGVLAFIKLHSRNLAIVLEASGWAMNDRLRLTTPLGRLFTRRPARPPGTHLEWTDAVIHLLALRGPSADDAVPASPRATRAATIAWLIIIGLAALALIVAASWPQPLPASVHPHP
jgi:hypothetical protein